jgi:hypothetical protein
MIEQKLGGGAKRGAGPLMKKGCAVQAIGGAKPGWRESPDPLREDLRKLPREVL